MPVFALFEELVCNFAKTSKIETAPLTHLVQDKKVHACHVHICRSEGRLHDLPHTKRAHERAVYVARILLLPPSNKDAKGIQQLHINQVRNSSRADQNIISRPVTVNSWSRKQDPGGWAPLTFGTARTANLNTSCPFMKMFSKEPFADACPSLNAFIPSPLYSACKGHMKESNKTWR